MFRLTALIAALVGSLLVLVAPAFAKVVSAVPARIVLEQHYETPLSPDALWAKLIAPHEWWQDDHTYSGSAQNLSLEPIAGGLWREDWEGGSVAHGRVLMAKTGEALTMEAPFGPLQALAVNTVLTLKIEPSGTGARLTMRFIASGSPESGLAPLAGPVDGVWAAALTALTAPEGP